MKRLKWKLHLRSLYLAKRSFADQGCHKYVELSEGGKVQTTVQSLEKCRLQQEHDINSSRVFSTDFI